MKTNHKRTIPITAQKIANIPHHRLPAPSRERAAIGDVSVEHHCFQCRYAQHRGAPYTPHYYSSIQDSLNATMPL